MTMRTRSKVGKEITGTGGKQESETTQVTDTGQENSQRTEQVGLTDTAGVKIKKELIEENIPVGLTETGTITDEIEVSLVNKEKERNSTGSHRNDIGGLQKLVNKNVRKTFALGDRRSLVPTHGKRRLSTASTRKRNKKYFQDIRQYAITTGFDHTKNETSITIIHDTEKASNKTSQL